LGDGERPDPLKERGKKNAMIIFVGHQRTRGSGNPKVTTKNPLVNQRGNFFRPAKGKDECWGDSDKRRNNDALRTGKKETRNTARNKTSKEKRRRGINERGNEKGSVTTGDEPSIRGLKILKNRGQLVKPHQVVIQDVDWEKFG